MLQILNDEEYIMVADLSRNFENVDNGIRFLQSDGGNPELENVAKAKGYRYLILESGEPLVAAMALYKNIGYVTIPNYGPYIDMPDSICMKKKL